MGAWLMPGRLTARAFDTSRFLSDSARQSLYLSHGNHDLYRDHGRKEASGAIKRKLMEMWQFPTKLGKRVFPVGQSWNVFWRDTVIAGIGAAALCGLAAVGHDHWQQWHNMRALKDLTSNAIKQAEYNIDYAILASFEVAQKAPEPCTPGGQRAIQSIIHGGSNIKDVITLSADGKMLCSAFPESSQQLMVTSGTPTRNENFALHRLSAIERDSLGVSWKADDASAILIALDLDAQLFAALPADIRDDARNSLIVTGIGEIASFGRAVNPQNSVFVTSSSDRFPVTTTLTLDNACFEKWNGENRHMVMSLGAILGLLLAGFLIRELRRPLSPRQQLQQAIRNNEIQPFAQATFDLASCEVTGCEILMRWIKPSGCSGFARPIHPSGGSNEHDCSHDTTCDAGGTGNVRAASK